MKVRIRINSRPWNNLFTEDGFMEIAKMIGEENIINVCRVRGLKGYMNAIGKLYKRGDRYPLVVLRHIMGFLIFYPKTSQNQIHIDKQINDGKYQRFLYL